MSSWYFFKKFLFSKNAGSVTKAISWLSVFGVGVSIMAIVVVLSVMGGFGNAIEERLLNFEPHLVVFSPEKTDEGTLNLTELSESLFSQFRTKSFLFDQDQVIVRTVSGEYSSAVARGLEEESLRGFVESARETNSRIKRFSWNGDTSSNENLLDSEIILGVDLAYQIGAFIGDEVILTPPETLLLPVGEIPETRTFTVRDILRTNVQDLDANLLLYKKERLLFKNSLSHETRLEVYLEDLSNLESVEKYILKNGFRAESWKERNSSLFYSLKMEKILIGFFLFLSALIGSFTVITVLVLLATQKKKEIGILMTLGMRQKELIALFSKIGFYLSLVGILGGFVAGLVICILLSNFRSPILPDVYYDQTIPVQFNFGFYLTVLVLALIVGFFSSYYPAKKISSFSLREILARKQ